jgi:pyridoxal phosphate enzyme (YggS family)
MTEIAERLAMIRARIDAAIARRGPGPDVKLIGVGKRQPLDKLLAAHAAGLRDFGENYAQELRDKQHDWASRRSAAEGPSELEVRWHYIGALQANKLKYLVGKTALIHTVDRAELITAIDERAARLGVTQPFLLEVAIAGEQQKAGVAPERVPELLGVCAQTQHGAARCVGLMIIPPAADDPEQTRPWFRALRELCELSMGMSADFEIAIEEGATLVRVGTSIFGERS